MIVMHYPLLVSSPSYALWQLWVSNYLPDYLSSCVFQFIAVMYCCVLFVFIYPRLSSFGVDLEGGSGTRGRGGYCGWRRQWEGGKVVFLWFILLWQFFCNLSQLQGIFLLKFEKSRFLGFLLPKGKLEAFPSKHLMLSRDISSLEGRRGPYVLVE